MFSHHASRWVMSASRMANKPPLEPPGRYLDDECLEELKPRILEIVKVALAHRRRTHSMPSDGKPPGGTPANDSTKDGGAPPTEKPTHKQPPGGSASAPEEPTNETAANDPLQLRRKDVVAEFNIQIDSLSQQLSRLVTKNSRLEKRNELLVDTISEYQKVKATIETLEADKERLTNDIKILEQKIQKHVSQPGLCGIPRKGIDKQKGKMMFGVSTHPRPEPPPPPQTGVGAKGKNVFELGQRATEGLQKPPLVSVTKPSTIQENIAEFKDTLTAAITERILVHQRSDEGPLNPQTNVFVSDEDVVTFFDTLDTTITRLVNMILRYQPIHQSNADNYMEFEEMRPLFLRWFIGRELFHFFFDSERARAKKREGLERTLRGLRLAKIDINTAPYGLLLAEYVGCVISKDFDQYFCFTDETAKEAIRAVQLALIQIAKDACEFSNLLRWNEHESEKRYRYVWLQTEDPFSFEGDQTKILAMYHAKTRSDAKYAWMCFGGIKREGGIGASIGIQVEEPVLLRPASVWFWNES